MKKYSVFFVGILLLTFSITIHPIDQAFAVVTFEEAELKKQSVENAIIDALETVGDKKTIKKIETAQRQFEKGNTDFDNEEYKKAIKHYNKSLKQIQKALSEPHAMKMKMKTVDEASGDMSHPPDGIDDIYVKIKNPGKIDKPLKVDLKISDACVDGDTAESAGMKMAFMTPGKFITNERLTDEGFDVTNKWFKKYDDNKQIDRFNKIINFFDLPPTGDDMIQSDLKGKKNSFKYTENGIDEIGGQKGWEGTFEIKGTSGEYGLLLFFKLLTSDELDSCDLISAIEIPITIP